MLIIESFRRRESPEQIRYVSEVGVLVANVEEGLGGTLGRAYDVAADTLFPLQVLDGLNIISVAGDEDVGVGVLRETHHVDDDAYIPIPLVRDGPLALGGER